MYDIFFEASYYPRRMIGPVQVIWKPPEAGLKRTLLLRMHPAIVKDVVKAIETAETVIMRGYEGGGTHYGDVCRHYRFNTSQFELTGPSAGEAIARVLRPVATTSKNTLKV